MAQQSDLTGEAVSYTTSLKKMMERVKNEPQQKMIYSGIKENSVGFIFGPSKSGKTTYCENLGLSIAAGLPTYLGKPLSPTNNKVLFLSLEEFYAGRTVRNMRQVEKIGHTRADSDWLENYVVATENIPRYVSTKEEWQIIREEIKTHSPGLVIIDSLSRLHEGAIEDSSLAKQLMKNLRELAHEMNSTIVVIHHTPKLENKPLSVHTMAGSRILAQDADFMIGINKTIDGKTYLKDVAFRYAASDSETVALLKLDEFQWFDTLGREDEAKLLSAFDGRRDEQNKDRVLEFIQERTATGGGVITTKELTSYFVDSKILSKDTLHNKLNSLVVDEKLLKLDKGKYKVAA